MFNIIILKLIIFLVASGLLCIIYYGVKNYKTEYISFREAIALSELPVITFYQENKKLNFLLDTGSTIGTIDKRVLPYIKSCPNKKLSRTIGIEGNYIDNILNVDIYFTYKYQEYKSTFQVMDMANTFDSIKKNTGVTVHGIIGNSFMQEYKYVLDFDSMVAYSKKKMLKWKK